MGGGKAARNEARRARQEEEARQKRVSEGTSLIRAQFAKNFDDPYYAKMLQQGKDYYGQNLEHDYKNSLKQLEAALWRSGLQSSGAGDVKRGEASKQLADAKLNIASMAQNQVNQRKQDVANAEGQTISQLQASADPASAAAQTSEMIRLNNTDPSWGAIPQFFTDLTANMATMADRDRYGGGVNRPSWFPSLGGGGGSRYTRNVGTG